MTATTPRASLRPRFVVAAVAFLFLLIAIPTTVRLFTLFPVQPEVSVAVAALMFLVLLGRVLHSCYQWVEIDGSTIRGRKLVTRRIPEREVRDIVGIRGMGLKDLGLPEAQASGDGVLGNRHGY